jgi:hypothetical protein
VPLVDDCPVDLDGDPTGEKNLQDNPLTRLLSGFCLDLEAIS